MTPLDLIKLVIVPSMAQLPPAMDNVRARVMLIAIALQESHLQYRRQLGNGPARGLWQFEQGTRASRGGVWGVYLHSASTLLLQNLCGLHKVAFDPVSIWTALETNDIFACGVARLMLWTDAASLPAPTDEVASWALYKRVWNPGKPRPMEWPGNHVQAFNAVTQG